MFDLTSSKLLILGVVALIVVGPRELPFLLRTIGKYVGMIRRQANEFRAQFDEAMREAELESIKKDVEAVARDAENSLRDAGASMDREAQSAQHAVADTLKPETAADQTARSLHSYDPLNGLDASAHETGPVHSEASHGDVLAADPVAIPITIPLPDHELVAAYPATLPELAPIHVPEPFPPLAKMGT